MTSVPKIKRALMWFRRDLRLVDNNALAHACHASEKVFFVFIFDKNIIDKLKKEDRRVTFLQESLKELKEDLVKKNSDIIIVYGDPKIEISKLADVLKVDAVFTNKDYESYAINRDKAVAKELKEKEKSFYLFKDHVIFEKEEIKNQGGDYYKVFTPYKKQWLKEFSKKMAEPKIIKTSAFAKTKDFKNKANFLDLKDMGFNYQKDNFIKGGRKAALTTHKKFVKENLKDYNKARDYPSLEATSYLSPHLRFGTISIRELVLSVYNKKDIASQTWLSELIWRDFYQTILSAFPEVEKQEFKEDYRQIKWQGKIEHFELWKEGKTGFPIIDAAMRHFKKTGWMHNRLRMVVASFLVKDLLIDWRKGEAYFAEKLLDFELASNNGGWQWSASTGCDAQPYFRIFNPLSQSERFDSEGEFIKKHLPELKYFSKKYIHSPAEAPIEVQKEASCLVGKDYPKPIVNHKVQRQKALAMFKEIKSK